MSSNSRECFREFIGQKLVGLLFDALPLSDRSIATGTKTLVFEDGRGLTISSKGTYWIESAKEVKDATARRLKELQSTQRDIEEVLALAGPRRSE